MAEHKALLLGLGFWGEFWLAAIQRSDRLRLAGVSRRHPFTKDELSKYGISEDTVFADYSEAITRTDASIAVIALPTEMHAEAVSVAIENGMHVICDKPVVSNMSEADMIRELCEKHPDQKLMVSQNYRWRPHNQTLKKAIKEGMIGQIGSVLVEFRRPEDLIGYREFLEMPLLEDVSIHHFDLIRFFTERKCEEIYATCHRPYWSKFPGKSSTEAIMSMEGGIVVNYNATWAARGKESSWDGNFAISGEKGCLTLDVNDAVHFFESGKAEGILIENVKMELTEIDYAVDNFVSSIEEGGRSDSDFQENYHSFSMLCAAKESVRLNKPVLLN